LELLLEGGGDENQFFAIIMAIVKIIFDKIDSWSSLSDENIYQEIHLATSGLRQETLNKLSYNQ
jgi:hypothetical protein